MSKVYDALRMLEADRLGRDGGSGGPGKEALSEEVPLASGGNGGNGHAKLEDEARRDPVIGPVFTVLRRVASLDVPVLFEGEMGTGREAAARELHSLSPRAPYPFLTLHCGALSERLLEAELLGVSGGARRRSGLFETANHGTVLLLEIEELPLRLQTIVRAVIDGLAVPGARGHAVCLDVRVVAATSVELPARVAAGLFQADLFDRLRRNRIYMAPLRERCAEIPQIASHFLRQCAAAGLPARGFSAEAIECLRLHTWPGNVWELRGVVETACLQTAGETVSVEQLPAYLRERVEALRCEDPPLVSLREVEMRHIERVVQEVRGNQRRASRILGISRWSLSRRLRKYGLGAGGPSEASAGSS